MDSAGIVSATRPSTRSVVSGLCRICRTVADHGSRRRSAKATGGRNPGKCRDQAGGRPRRRIGGLVGRRQGLASRASHRHRSRPLLPVPRTAPAIAAASAPRRPYWASSTTAVIPARHPPVHYLAGNGLGVRWEGHRGDLGAGRNTNRSTISTTTVARPETPKDACLSSHDRGCTTTSRVSMRAAAVTTSTRAARPHDGCDDRAVTVVDGHRSQGVEPSESTATGPFVQQRYLVVIAASAAADTAVSATTSTPQHNRRMAPDRLDHRAMWAHGVGSGDLNPVLDHRHR